MSYKKRDSRFEILRIISMIFIISSHFSLYGNWADKNKHIISTMQFQPLGQIGVYLFVMISGYFLSTRSIDFKDAERRIMPLWEKTILYSIFACIIAIILRLDSINIKAILKSVLPISLNEYWFMTSFILLMFMTPLLNYLINNYDKKTLQYCILGIVVVADIYPLLNNSPLGGILSSSVLISSYLIAGYIQKYKFNVKNYWLVFLIVLGLGGEYISMYVMNLLHHDPLKFTNGILPLLAAIGIFIAFIKMPGFYNRYINFFASSVLAAYLLTMHQTIYNWFWKDFIDVGKFQYSPCLTLIGLGISLVIVLVCCLFDKVMQSIGYGLKRLVGR